MVEVDEIAHRHLVSLAVAICELLDREPILRNLPQHVLFELGQPREVLARDIHDLAGAGGPDLAKELVAHALEDVRLSKEVTTLQDGRLVAVLNVDDLGAAARHNVYTRLMLRVLRAIERICVIHVQRLQLLL